MSKRELEALMKEAMHSQKPKRKGGSYGTSAMQGERAECHALDGILDFSEHQSMYGGLSPAYYGPLTDNAQVGLTTFGRGTAKGGMLPVIDEGGRTIGGFAFAPLVAALAPIAIKGVMEGVSHLIGKGECECIGGAYDSYFDLNGNAAGLQGGYDSFFDVDSGDAGLQGGKIPLVEALKKVGRRAGGASGSYFDVDSSAAGVTGGRRGSVYVSTGVPSMPGSQVTTRRKAGSKNVKDMGRGSALQKRAAASNPWLIEVKRVRAENPGLAYKDVLKLAKQSYRK